MAAPTVEDLVQTFAKGITRPETEEDGYSPYASARNFVYAPTFGTTVKRPVGVPVGWTYYDTTEGDLFVWDGVDWSSAGGGGGLTAPADPADDGKLAVADSGDIVWTAGSAVTVGVATYANGIRETSGPTTLAMGAAADLSLLSRSGSSVVGLAPGAVMTRRTAASTNLQALTFTANALRTWDGTDDTPTFTVDSTGAIDGATIIIYFPAATLAAINFDADIDPTGTLAYAFDNAAHAYELMVTWRAQGYVIASFRKVQLA